MKQVIVVNRSLKLPKGKLSAQVAHAAVAAFIEASMDAKKKWLENGMPKVVLRVESEDELFNILSKAKKNKIPAVLIEDAGRTVVQKGTVTCLGIGPDLSEKVEEITGHLKLL